MHPVGRSRDLPTDDKLAELPRKKFYGCCCASSSFLLGGSRQVPLERTRSAKECSSGTPIHLPEGDGLGGSLPDSSIVGRIGPIPSRFVLRDFRGRDAVPCSIGVSRFTGLGVSGMVGFGAGAPSTSGSRVFVRCETDRSFNPSAARSPAARISSSVSAAGADFFSRDWDSRGAGVGVSEGVCSERWTVCFGASGFFSRATITSCACIFPMRMTPQSSARKNCFSMMPPDKRMNPFTSPRS